MLDEDLLKSIAAQLMTSTSVDVEGKSIPVRHTSRQRLKAIAFRAGGHDIRRSNRTHRNRADGDSLREMVVESSNSKT